MKRLEDYAELAKNITASGGGILIVIKVGQEVDRFIEPWSGKLKYWSSKLKIKCPKCDNIQNYKLVNIKKGRFSKHTRCKICDKKITLDIKAKKIKNHI